MDLNKLMQQAQAMQKQLEASTNKLNETQFEASSSNGLVKVIATGDNKIKSIDIDESIINKEDKDMIQDLIMIAINEAVDKIDAAKKQSLSAIAPGLKL